MIGRRSPRPLRPARRLTTIGATIAMAMTLPVAAGAPMASAEPRPDLAELTPTIAANGSISTFGGCNSGIPFLIRSCTEAETITTGYPMQLRMRPEGHHIVVLGYGLQENGALRAELIRRLTSARDIVDGVRESALGLVKKMFDTHGANIRARGLREKYGVIKLMSDKTEAVGLSIPTTIIAGRGTDDGCCRPSPSTYSPTMTPLRR